jgi:uncharacterized membrane protein
VADQEQPEVVLADPQRLQALRRALEERAVLTYCTDGATFRYQRPLSARCSPSMWCWARARLRAVIVPHDNDPIAVLGPELMVQRPPWLRGAGLQAAEESEQCTWRAAG